MSNPYEFKDGETVIKYRKRMNPPSWLTKQAAENAKKAKLRKEKGIQRQRRLSLYTKKKRREARLLIIDHKKACQLCGEDDFRVLVYHHIHKSSKKFGLGTFSTESKKEVIEEIKKCIVICINCHRKIHNNYTIDPDYWKFGEDIRLSPVRRDEVYVGRADKFAGQRVLECLRRSLGG